MLPGEVIEQLRSRPILTPAQILAVKQDLNRELAGHPNYAKYLAKRLHALIDEHLPSLEQDLLQQLRLELWHRAVQQTNFHLSALDVVDTCTSESYSEILPSLRQWLRELHAVEISQEALTNYLHGTTAIVEVLEVPTPKGRSWHLAALALAVTCVTIAITTQFLPLLQANSEPKTVSKPVTVTVSQTNSLPAYLQYKAINEAQLITYLEAKNSLLAEATYREAVNLAAMKFNLNPLLLWAIMGQEQGFVPKTNPQAAKIANNPFNVFHSWQEYNTNIADSATIASRTVVNLSANRPETADPFQWINRRYAEDKQWWKGVKSIFADLEAKVGYRKEL